MTRSPTGKQQRLLYAASRLALLLPIGYLVTFWLQRLMVVSSVEPHPLLGYTPEFVSLPLTYGLGIGLLLLALPCNLAVRRRRLRLLVVLTMLLGLVTAMFAATVLDRAFALVALGYLVGLALAGTAFVARP